MGHFYPDNIASSVEFDEVLEKLQELISSDLGHHQLNNQSFTDNIDHLNKELWLIEKFKVIVDDRDTADFNHFINLDEELKLLAVKDATPEQSKLFCLLLFLENFKQHYHLLQKYSEDYEEIGNFISHCDIRSLDNVLNNMLNVFHPEGTIRDDASPKLKEIRNRIFVLESGIDRTFEVLLKEYRSKAFLSEEEQSIRKGDRVLAIQSKNKRKVKGVIVDESATSKTVFIQPEQVLDMLNELFSLQQSEKREVFRILKQLCNSLRPSINDIHNAQYLSGRIDLLYAKARFAIKINGNKPHLCSEPQLDIIQAVHPLLYLKNKDRNQKTVALDVELNTNERIMIISGPNAGGKTVCLKTICLLQLMLQSGLLLPLSGNSKIHPFQKIIVDIGDNQSIDNDLSTYTSRLTLMKDMINLSDKRTIFLIDEMGTGTDPRFGGLIAATLLKRLNEVGSFGVVTTHYHDLKLLASENPGIVNASMLFDRENLRPLYLLEKGKPGSSYTFEIIQHIGFDEEFIKELENNTSEKMASFDQMLIELQEEKTVLTEMRNELEIKEEKLNKLISQSKDKEEALGRKHNKILNEVYDKTEEYLQKINRDFERLILEWKREKVQEQKEDKSQIIREKIRTERKKIPKQTQTNPEIIDFKAGDYVSLINSKRVGQIISISNKKAEVVFDNSRIRTEIANLIAAKPENTGYTSIVIRNIDTMTESFNPVLDVRGLRRDEALESTEKFLEKAMLQNINYLKIIHGYGDGILKNAIRTYLKTSNLVESFQKESYEYGGDGVTLINLR